MKRWTLLILIALLLGVITTTVIAWKCAYDFDGFGESYVPSADELAFWQDRAPNFIDSELKSVSQADDFGVRIEMWTGVRHESQAYHDWRVEEETGRIRWGGGHSEREEDYWSLDQWFSVSAGWPAYALTADRWTSHLPSGRFAEARLAIHPYCLTCGFTSNTTPCPYCASAFRGQVPTVDRGIESRGLIRRTSVGPLGPVWHHIPTRPLWRGMFINTLFFGVLWVGLFVGVVVSHRQIRKQLANARQRRGRCPRCGYDLRGDFDDGCSECGWNRGAPGSANSQEPTAKGVSP